MQHLHIAINEIGVTEIRSFICNKRTKGESMETNRTPALIISTEILKVFQTLSDTSCKRPTLQSTGKILNT